MTDRKTGKAPRIGYRRPLPVYVPVLLMFILFNYIGICVVETEANDGRVLPEYLNKLDPTSVLGKLAHLYEVVIVEWGYRTCSMMFMNMTGIRVVLALAWGIHIVETSVCLRICRECHASAWTTLLYVLGTLTSGYAQLISLQKARDEYVTRYVIASANTPTMNKKTA